MISYSVLYEEVNRLLLIRPDFADAPMSIDRTGSLATSLSEECKVWIEEGQAVVDTLLNLNLSSDWARVTHGLFSPSYVGAELTRLLYRARALTRLQLPPAERGGVTDPAKPYSTFVIISEVLAVVAPE